MYGGTPDWAFLSEAVMDAKECAGGGQQSGPGIPQVALGRECVCLWVAGPSVATPIAHGLLAEIFEALQHSADPVAYTFGLDSFQDVWRLEQNDDRALQKGLADDIRASMLTYCAMRTNVKAWRHDY